MGNCCCCCTDSSDDRYPFATSSSTINVGSRNRQVTSRTSGRPSTRSTDIIPRERSASHTEFFRPTSNPMTPTSQSEDNQVRMAQRRGIIGQIPTGTYDGISKKHSECAICMIDFDVGDEIKYLPCMHVYHKDCVDDWLVRSLTCPACMEPVDAALLSTFDSFTESN